MTDEELVKLIKEELNRLYVHPALRAILLRKRYSIPILKELIKSEYVNVQSFLSKIPDDHRAKNVATIKYLIVANALRYDTKGCLRFQSKMEYLKCLTYNIAFYVLFQAE